MLAGEAKILAIEFPYLILNGSSTRDVQGIDDLSQVQ